MEDIPISVTEIQNSTGGGCWRRGGEASFEHDVEVMGELLGETAQQDVVGRPGRALTQIGRHQRNPKHMSFLCTKQGKR